MKPTIPANISRKIGYYVYLYIDPRNRRVFYVGKGKGKRVLSHWTSAGESRKAKIIRNIRAAGYEPLIDILAHGLQDAETAFRIEAAVIDALGLDKLANRARGLRSLQLGRMSLRQLVTHYDPKSARIRHRVLLVRISRLFRHGMLPKELYEATRGVWKLSQKRAATAEYALATYEGIVQEVYKIKKWYSAGSTLYRTRKRSDVLRRNRIEFVGHRAEEQMRRLYLGRSVRQHLPPGLRSPVRYVNC